MATETASNLAQPGQNHPNSIQPVHQAIAQAASALTGQEITPQDVKPPQQQSPMPDPKGQFEPHPEADWDDIMAGFTGKPRTEKSSNFLTVLKGKLSKVYPGKKIVEKEKE